MKIILALFTLMLLQSATANSFPVTAVEHFGANLYIINADGTTSLEDGNITIYDPSYSNGIDLEDFKKMTNFAENFAILRDNTELAIEKKQPVNDADTIFFKMWQMQQKSYQLELIATALDHPGLTGYIEDSYLHTITPIGLNTTTMVDFTITADAASANMYRFRVIFKTVKIDEDPVTICSFKATKLASDILVEWKAKHENNIKEYLLEKSTDGNKFSTAASITAIQNKQVVSAYQYLDRKALPGNNYYRIKNIYSNGKASYSKLITVNLIINKRWVDSIS